MARLPFTTSLTNIGFIAKIALLARLGVAVIRTVINAPFLNPNKEMNASQKRASFVERATIEILGTLIYASGMYLAMDGAAGLFERFKLKPQFEAIQDSIKAFEDAGGDSQVGKLFNRVFSGGVKETVVNGEKVVQANGKINNLIHKHILGSDFKGRYGGTKADYWVFKDGIKNLSGDTKNILKQVAKFSRSLNKSSMLTQFMGIGAACVLGGPILQTFNDKVVRPFALHLTGTDTIKPKTRLEHYAQSPLMIKPVVVRHQDLQPSPSVVVVPKKPAKAYKPGFVPFEPNTPPLHEILPSTPPPGFPVLQAPLLPHRAALYQVPVFRAMPSYNRYAGGAVWSQ